MQSTGRPATLIAYTGTRPDAPLIGGTDMVTGKPLEVFWAGSTLGMAQQFQDGQIRKLRIELKHPLVIPDEDREAMCGQLSHARIAEKTLKQARLGKLPYDGIIFLDTADGMEVADVVVVFPKDGSVDHAVEVLSCLTHDEDQDAWIATDGFYDNPPVIALSCPHEDETIAANGRAVRENFAHWFRSSEHVNYDGSPRLFFHGTRSDFDEFKPGAWQTGLFFTTEPDYAEERAIDDAQESYVSAEVVLPVYLSAQKVLDVRKGIGAQDEQALLQAGASLESLDWVRTSQQDQYYVFERSLGGEDFVAACLRAGFDGVAFNETNSTNPMSAYAVFSPAQVKSAIGNSGLYLPHSASLTDHAASIALNSVAEAKSCIEGIFAHEASSPALGVRP